MFKTLTSCFDIHFLDESQCFNNENACFSLILCDILGIKCSDLVFCVEVQF